MRLLERLHRGHTLSGALLLCLTLVGVGNKVDFEFVQSNKGYIVTAVK